MKRNGTSITALALAGLIVLPLAPNAAAQSSVEVGPIGPLGSSASASVEGWSTQGAADAGASASAGANGSASAGANGSGSGSANGAGSADANANSGSSLDGTGSSLPWYEEGKKAGELNGETWWFASNPKYVVNSENLIKSTALEAGMAGVLTVQEFAEKLGKLQPANLTFGLDGGVEGGSSASDLAKAAAIVLPALLLIGGVTWYLNADGQTYVTDSSRTSSTPTAGEREASANMLSSNRAEVEAQAKAQADAQAQAETQPNADSTVTLDRGITAETGNNTFGKGIIALLLASVLGAVAFAFGRRQLV